MYKFVPFAGLLLCFLTSCTSCALDSQSVLIWGGDVTLPKMVGLTTVSENELSVGFTSPVSVIKAGIVVGESPSSVISVTWHPENDKKSVRFMLSESPGIGVSAALSATVCDERGNSLSLLVPFTGFNSRIPVLKINEIRTDYSKPKVEFIEFYVVKGGNLGGVEIQNAMNKVKSSYEFPPVEVSAGDYIVYHLRSVEEGIKDEMGALDESGGIDSRPNARDFWDTLTSAPLKKTNVLVVRERRGGVIMDALLCSESGKIDWPSDAALKLAEEAYADGAWVPESKVTDAVCMDGSTATRTLGRDPLSSDTGSALDWKVCDKGKCSPGSANVPH